MEENFFRRPAVAGVLQEFVEARLHTDGVKNIDRILELRDLYTGSYANPMYVVVDTSDEEKLALFEGPTFDEGEYISFLRTGS